MSRGLAHVYLVLGGPPRCSMAASIRELGSSETRREEQTLESDVTSRDFLCAMSLSAYGKR